MVARVLWVVAGVVSCYGLGPSCVINISGTVSFCHTNAVNHCGRAVFTHIIQENTEEPGLNVRHTFHEVCV